MYELDMAYPPGTAQLGAGLHHPSRVKLRDDLAKNLVVRAREDFLIFVQLVYPDFQIGPHHRLLAKKLMELEKGTTKRLMFFLPPRSSKSLMASVLFPAWVLGRHARWFLMNVSYGAKLSEGFGRDVRDLVARDIYSLIFPETKLRADVKAAGKWHTTSGGQFNAAGTTGGIAGRGAHVAIIDDPLSEQDAYSKASRQHVIDWYPAGLRSRLQPSGRIALVMTRWHEDDLAGHLLREAENDPKADQWEVVNVPAILTDETGNESSYWPVSEAGRLLAEKEGIHTGWPLEELVSTRDNMPSYQWNALYMQAPSSEEGAIIKREYWKKWREYSPPNCEYILMSCDTAFGARETNDYNAFTRWGIFHDHNGIPNVVLLGAEKHRLEYPELRVKAQDLYEQWAPDGVLIEKKASGQSLLQDMRSGGVPVIEYNPDRDKVARAHVCTPIMHAGRVHVPDMKWVEEVIDECAAFPYGKHDDYVDTVTQAIIWMKDSSWVSHPTDDWDEDDYQPSRRKLY